MHIRIARGVQGICRDQVWIRIRFGGRRLKGWVVFTAITSNGLGHSTAFVGVDRLITHDIEDELRCFQRNHLRMSWQIDDMHNLAWCGVHAILHLPHGHMSHGT